MPSSKRHHQPDAVVPEIQGRMVLDGTLARAPSPGASRICASEWTAVEYAYRLGYVEQAWSLAGSKYALGAIQRDLGEHFEDVVQGVLAGLLVGLGVVVVTTGVGAAGGAVVGLAAGGVGAAPGAAGGAVLGFEAGMVILNILGIGCLLYYLHETLPILSDMIVAAIRTAWDSCGNPAAIDAAARQFADAISMIFVLVVDAALALLAREGWVRGMAQLKNSKFGARLAAFLSRPRNLSMAEKVDRYLKLMNMHLKPTPSEVRAASMNGLLPQASAEKAAVVMARVRTLLGLDKRSTPYKPDAVRSRMETAIKFLEQEFGSDEIRVAEYLKGIDFSKDVSLTRIPAGTRYVQYQSKPAVGDVRIGEFFTEKGTSVRNVGVDAQGRLQVVTEFKQDVWALKSTAGPINANFQAKTAQELIQFRVEASGGGVQYFVPRSQHSHIQQVYMQIEPRGAAGPSLLP